MKKFGAMKIPLASVRCHIEMDRQKKMNFVNKRHRNYIFSEKGFCSCQCFTLSYVLLSQKHDLYILFHATRVLIPNCFSFAIEFSCSSVIFLILLMVFIYFRLFLESSNNFCMRYAFKMISSLYKFKRMENLIIFYLSIY